MWKTKQHICMENLPWRLSPPLAANHEVNVEVEV